MARCHSLVAARWLRVFLAGLLAVSAALSPGCAGSGSGGKAAGGNGPVTIDYAETPAQAATRLATALTSAKTLDEVRPAAYEALARTGIAVKTAKGDVLAKTGSRALTLWLFEEQSDNLAMDFLEHQGWTLDVLTQAVAEYPEGPGPELLKQPQTLGVLLREWAALAEKSPEDPEAFAPLLLARIAQVRGGGSDFTKGKIVPEQVEFSYLELMILTAGAFAAPPSSSQGSMRPEGTPGERPEPAAAWVPFAAAPAYAAAGGNPCTWIQEKWGEEAQDFAEEGGGAIFDKALDKVRDWLTGKGESGLAGGMKTAGSVFKWANFLTSMIAMYGGYSLTLTWDPAKPHYLGYDGGHGDVRMEVTANVSTRPQGDDATLDCLKWAGVEKPKSDSVKDCTVEWVPLYGTPKHAVVTSKDFKRQHVNSDGKAVLKLDMTAEKATEAGRSGKLKNDQIVIQADLTTYKASPSKIMAAALFGGAAGGNLEVAKGWINKWFPKRAVARIPVEWHYLPRWRGVVDRPDGTRWVFTSGQGLKSNWTVTLEGGPVEVAGMSFSPEGKGSFDLKDGEASTQLQRKMVATVAGQQITMATTLPMTIVLGGTDEAPTLEVANGPGQNVISARGQSRVGPVEPGGQTTVILTELPE